MNPDRALALLEAANPLEDVSPFVPDAAEVDVFVSLMRTDRGAVVPPLRRWRGPILAVAATAVTLLVIGALGLLSPLSDEPPTTEPTTTIAATTTTTTQPPTTTSTTEPQPTTTVFDRSPTVVEQALIDAYLSTLNDGDADTFAGLFHPEVTLLNISSGSEFPVPFDKERTLYEIASALGAERTFMSCEHLDTLRITCILLYEDELTRVLGLDPYRTNLRLQFDEEGLITEQATRVPEFSGYWDSAELFQIWMDENHPEVQPLVFSKEYTLESGTAALLLEFLPLYAATL